MEYVYKGRPLIRGEIWGEAVVSRRPVNTLAVFMKSVIFFSGKAIGGDPNNTDLFKQQINGNILCLPDSTGSTTAGLVIMSLVKKGLAPGALLFSKSIDSLAVSGVILSDVWIKHTIITIDRLGNDFLDNVETGDDIEISYDGSIGIYKKPAQ
jgi:predicted aconitase with swiveling domain